MRFASLVRRTMFAAVAACSSKPTGRTVRVAAASDLSKAFEEVAKQFRARTGITPDIVYGSSGVLAKQIEQGAPFFLFAAANQRFVQNAVDSGRCDGASATLYARGRIGVWTRDGIAPPASLAELGDPRFKRIAIANPEHAPYGAAASQALRKLGLWSRIEDRIVLAENVSEATRWAGTGNVEAAVTARSLAAVADGGTFLAIDPELHDPLDQQMVVCGSGEEADAARQLAAFISSRDGRAIMARFGFSLPDSKQ